MTIVFQGHVRAITKDALSGQVAVTLVTPMAETGGKDWVVFVDDTQAKHWLPGRMVSFTIYTLQEPKASLSVDEALRLAREKSGSKSATTEAIELLRDWVGDFADTLEGGESNELVVATRAAIAKAETAGMAGPDA